MQRQPGLYPSWRERVLWFLLGLLPVQRSARLTAEPVKRTWWQKALVIVVEALIQKVK